MRAIFISYRREDAEGQAGRLFDDLVTNFGNGSVFMDVAGIEPGRDFREAIDEQVATCGVLLALIGTNWLEAHDKSGRRRLDDPMDFVRLETAAALKRDIPVIPVLVRGASMPPVEILPEDLKKLAFRNAVELTHARWDSDVQVLVKALRSYVQAREPAAARSGPSGFVIAALGSVLVLALAGYLWLQKSSEGAAREVEQTGLGDPPIVRQASGGQTAPAAPVESDSASSPVPVPSPSGTSSTVISSVVVVGPSEGIYSTYDESGQKYLGSRSLGNALALFPGNYLIEVSGIRKPLTVREGQRASLAVGSAVVVGPSEGIYSTYDESGQEYLGSRSLGNALALFPGNYLIEVNGVRRPVTVWSAQQAQVHWPSRS